MQKILVVGDVMLDRYIFGDVTRISQEAPVPIVKRSREEIRAGAAANVALNCKAMAADVHLISVIGSDKYGADLENLVGASGVSSELFVINGGLTTQKLRVIGKQQQIVRIDTEEKAVFSQLFMSAVNRAFEYADIVIFSDYGKGALSNIADFIARAKHLGKIVLVDPKGHNLGRYRGADLVKPNLDEMRALIGGWDSEEELAEKANAFLENGGFKAILLTRAAEGMSLFTADGITHIPTAAQEVYDVSGAGDTAIAAFAVSLAKGHSFSDATRYANKAAGVAVGKFGTAIITEEEVFFG